MKKCNNPLGNTTSFVFVTKRQLTSITQKNCPEHTFITYNIKKGMVTRCSKCNYKQRKPKVNYNISINNIKPRKIAIRL